MCCLLVVSKIRACSPIPKQVCRGAAKESAYPQKALRDPNKIRLDEINGSEKRMLSGMKINSCRHRSCELWREGPGPETLL